MFLSIISTTSTIPQYLVKFDINYIIFKNNKIYRKNVFSKKIMMENLEYIICWNEIPKNN
jgi:hypothetical protein